MKKDIFIQNHNFEMNQLNKCSLSGLFSRKTTLCVTHSVENIFIRSKNLVVIAKGIESVIPIEKLRRVILVGKAHISSVVLYKLMRDAVSIDWLDHFGHPLGQLLAMGHNPEAMLPAQVAFCKGDNAVNLARAILLAKIDNCKKIIRRRCEWDDGQWRQVRSDMAASNSVENLRGLEGYAARLYFSHWHGILHQFVWLGRHARPAPDPVNLLLSFGYSLLHNRMVSALRHAGLYARQGFFHKGRGTHNALASDLMEPLRALVDARVLNLVRRQKIAPDNFTIKFGRCACADSNTFAKVLGEFEAMFETMHNFYFSEPALGACEKRSVNDIIDDMAESFAVHIHDLHGCIIPRLAACVTI